MEHMGQRYDGFVALGKSLALRIQNHAATISISFSLSASRARRPAKANALLDRREENNCLRKKPAGYGGLELPSGIEQPNIV